MSESGYDFGQLLLLTGTVVVLAMVIKTAFDRTAFPSLVGFLILGFGLKLVDTQFDLMGETGHHIFHFLAKIGLFALLFRIGMESNLKRLAHQLRGASVVWALNLSISGLFGFVTAYSFLRFPLIPSLMVGAALTATSVGISVDVWKKRGALDSDDGSLLLDTAELDDISAVIIMALMLSIAPTLKSGESVSILPTLGYVGGLFVIKLIAFAVGCTAFAYLVERRVQAFFVEKEPPEDFILIVAGIGLVIASFAAMLGFSIAIGAFFAGLVFSNDPKVLKRETSFMPLHEMFAPFFFIGIGLSIDPAAFSSSAEIALPILVAAVLGKVVGTGIPVCLMKGRRSAVLIGVSMVPRAEIAMVIAQTAVTMGAWALPADAYGAIVLVCAATCLVTPVVVNQLLSKWPQGNEQSKGAGS
jgi:Kef-type K+ transport system membrane component KefB